MENQHSRRRFLHMGLLTAGAALTLPRIGFSLQHEHANFTLDPLPYAYNALEPHIDAQTMEIHHSRHHKAYVDNLNRLCNENHVHEMSLKPFCVQSRIIRLASETTEEVTGITGFSGTA